MQSALQRVLWGLLALAAVPSGMANRVFVGELQQTAVHGKESSISPEYGRHNSSHVHRQQVHLRLRTGEMRRLLFPKAPSKLPRSGSWVMVRTLPLQQCVGGEGIANAMCVGSILAQEGAARDSFAAGQPRGPIKLKSLIMQLQVCGQGPATTPENLAAALFEGEPGSQAETVQGMFTACSHGNADFSRASGKWSDVANDYVKHVLGINWEEFKYKIYVVPPGDLCSWGGLGWVGCKSDCRAWISGDLWMYPTTWMHELGHNLYLNHAGSFQQVAGGGTQFVAYKDDSGAMGHCCSTRCFNAPHSHQLGWSKAVDTLNKDNFGAGEWRSYTLPPRAGQGSRDANLIRVQPDWDGPAAAFNLFLEYRKGASYDAGLLPSVRDKVMLYSTPGSDAMPFTTFEVAIGPNQISHESRIGSHLAIWVGSESAEGIQVNLCRPLNEHEVNCSDGRDDDYVSSLLANASSECASGVVVMTPG
ncbi:Gametolysin peptidase M11-domain-containing protein [Scenedesmus sp. NREL 46B-D3]|nr:Gametolysin peptidase M11-domain-containing protein [Scenedesmus sp. NREL 46B-D3]